MSKRRIIIPNTKVDKNNIGKQGLRFDEIYANNIIAEKLNNKIVDPDYYLKDNFTIIYPNGGSKEAPANISPNTSYVVNNPFPNFIVQCIAEFLLNGQWIECDWETNAGSGSYGFGVSAKLNTNNDTITINAGRSRIIGISDGYTGPMSIPKVSNGNLVHDGALPCRVLVWKVGKISDDD